MPNKTLTDMLDEKHTLMKPEQYIDYMYARTDEDGILYISGWHLPDEPPHSYCCNVEWSLRDSQNLKRDFDKLYANLQVIAGLWSQLGKSAAENCALFKNDNVFATWSTYIRVYNTDGFDLDIIEDIFERMNTLDEVKRISKKLLEDEEITQHERAFMKKYLDVSISEKESEYIDKYITAFQNEATERLGKSLCASVVINRARRVCRLMSLNAPEFVVDNEARVLAAAMVVNRFGLQKKTVDDAIRIRREALDELDDDALDELYRPKKTNSRKSMAPLFVYLIIKEYSNVNTPLRQQKILEYLKEDPYEIIIERKALSRIIHNLIDSGLNIQSDSKKGTWFEGEKNI